VAAIHGRHEGLNASVRVWMRSQSLSVPNMFLDFVPSTIEHAIMLNRRFPVGFVRRDVAAVELHALDHLEFGLERLGFFNRDETPSLPTFFMAFALPNPRCRHSQILLIWIKCHGPERGIGLKSDLGGGRCRSPRIKDILMAIGATKTKSFAVGALAALAASAASIDIARESDFKFESTRGNCDETFAPC